MNINSGTVLFLIIFGSSLTLLILILLIMAIVAKKKGRIPAAGKAFSVILASISFAFSILTPLVHHNVIDINLRFGYFTNRVLDNGTKIKINRDSISYYPNGGESKQGTYSLNNDILTISYKDGTTEIYEVKDFGTHLYKDGVKVYSYLKDQGGL